MFGWILVALIVVVLAYIRLAPTDAARWHKPVTATEDKKLAGGAIRVLPAGEGDLARFVQVAAASPRTEVLAGTAEDGRVTLISRTKWIGFPDYTTIEQTDGQLRIFGRLRFGRSDLGVNAARIEGWIRKFNGG